MSYVVQSILAYDKDIDLAVLKINADGLSVPTICYKEHPVGTEVYTIGSSKGLTDTFSSGMITYANREIDDSGLTFSTSGYYYVGEDKIELVGYFTNHTKAAMTFITIDSVDGVYDWDYIDSDNYYICGTLYAATWTADSLLVPTRYSGIPALNQASYLEIASKVISLTVYCITYNYADIDVSAADFGFVHPDFAV